MHRRPLAIPPGAVRDRVFVTGVYGSGKTYFAQRHAQRAGIPMVSFDHQFDYTRLDVNQSKAILGRLPPAFVMDAIPFDEHRLWGDFAEYEARHDVLIVCVYCPDAVQWLNRVAGKNDHAQLMLRWNAARRLHPAFPLRAWRLARQALGTLRRTIGRARRKTLTLNNREERQHLHQYRDFYTRRLAHLRAFRHVIFYDSLHDEYTTEQEMLRRMRSDAFRLHDRLDEAGAGYDAMYQDIEALNAVGYSESYKSWENIQGLVRWRGQRVTDLGCFHGYFSFKAEDAGAIVRGLDRSADVLETARMINQLRGGRAEFAQWTGGEPVPECDVILCLNVLHHFGDAATQEKVVAGMRCRTAVFEINAESLPMIERHFHTVTRHPSHRPNRLVLVAAGPRASGK